MVQPAAVSFTLILAYIPLICDRGDHIVSLVLVRATLRYSEQATGVLALSVNSSSASGPRNCTSNWTAVISDAKIICYEPGKISVLMQMVPTAQAVDGRSVLAMLPK